MVESATNKPESAAEQTATNGLNANEFKVYDRQLRLWGFEA